MKEYSSKFIYEFVKLQIKCWLRKCQFKASPSGVWVYF